MLLPLVYYLVAFFVYIFAYEYYRNRARKQVVNLDFLKNLESIPLNLIPRSNIRSFDKIKKQIAFYCYFDQVRITFGIDLSASNEWQGRKSFQGQSLHKTQSNKIYNPYQKVISQLGILFEEIFATKLEYSCFAFGDENTKDYTYSPLIGTGDKFRSYQHVLTTYLEKTKDIALSGPTSFIPIIKQLMLYGIHCRKDLTILFILTDELKISHQDPSIVAMIRFLANLPNVCLIIIGLGDGPWQKMSYEEHRLRELLFRKIDPKKQEMNIDRTKVCYDNFHFVNYNTFASQSENNETDNYFLRAILTKLPTQLKQAFRNHQTIVQF